MQRFLARITLVTTLAAAAAASTARGEWPKAGYNQPDGFCHYRYYYNPRADYGPYYRGCRHPLYRSTFRLLTGQPYPGYYWGFVPGVRPGPHLPYTSVIGGMPYYGPNVYDIWGYRAKSEDTESQSAEAPSSESVAEPMPDETP
ncbi:MAG TPA: hypothetical protein VHV77_05040 [Pirellulales bacterium]|jgi:hypothetical protein|nr:hypothetical protein [Pirellulales bacterium]